jgi:hypothetical protein
VLWREASSHSDRTTWRAIRLYPKEEIIGRNCRFLQGKHTNKETVKKIRFAVDNGLPLDVELFNYRKDGTGS